MQVRKPGRWVGLPFAWLMNLSHSRLTDWGLRHVHIDNKQDLTILDVGCGGGRTIQKLAAIAVIGKSTESITLQAALRPRAPRMPRPFAPAGSRSSGRQFPRFRFPIIRSTSP